MHVIYLSSGAHAEIGIGVEGGLHHMPELLVILYAGNDARYSETVLHVK